MRTKEQILKIVTKRGMESQINTEAVEQALIVELLVDIRDELVKLNKRK